MCQQSRTRLARKTDGVTWAKFIQLKKLCNRKINEIKKNRHKKCYLTIVRI